MQTNSEAFFLPIPIRTEMEECYLVGPARSKTNLLLSPVPLTGWILLNQVRGLRVHGYPDNKALDVKDESQKNQQVPDALG